MVQRGELFKMARRALACKGGHVLEQEVLELEGLQVVHQGRQAALDCGREGCHLLCKARPHALHSKELLHLVGEEAGIEGSPSSLVCKGHQAALVISFQNWVGSEVDSHFWQQEQQQ